MPRRTHALPDRIFWCSDRALVSPTPFRSAARHGETSRSCPTVLPGLRLYARAGDRSAPSGPSLRRSPAPCPIGWPCDPAAVDCVHRPVPVLLLPLTAPSPASRPGVSMRPRPGAASPPPPPSATPFAPPDFHPRPFPRAALQLAALQSDMVSS